MIYKPNFFVITGGPGVGKTTLLETLAQQGFPYVPEIAREIIREQVSRNGDPTDCCPTAKRLCDTVLSLPVHPYITEEEIETVCSVILGFVR